MRRPNGSDSAIPVKVGLRFDRDKGMQLEIECKTSGISFLDLNVSAENVTALMSNSNGVSGDVILRGLDLVGLKHECKSFDFEFDMTDIDYSKRADMAYKAALSLCPDGWEPDNYFSSQSSFFKHDGVQFASCTIRRYI